MAFWGFEVGEHNIDTINLSLTECCMLGCRQSQQSDGALRCCSALSVLYINTDVTVKKVAFVSLTHSDTRVWQIYVLGA